MNTLIALMMLASLSQEPMELAMKSFEIGPPQAQMKIMPKNEISAPAGTNHILAEDDKVITAEDDKQLTLD